MARRCPPTWARWPAAVIVLACCLSNDAAGLGDDAEVAMAHSKVGKPKLGESLGKQNTLHKKKTIKECKKFGSPGTVKLDYTMFTSEKCPSPHDKEPAVNIKTFEMRVGTRPAHDPRTWTNSTEAAEECQTEIGKVAAKWYKEVVDEAFEKANRYCNGCPTCKLAKCKKCPKYRKARKRCDEKHKGWKKKLQRLACRTHARAKIVACKTKWVACQAVTKAKFLACKVREKACNAKKWVRFHTIKTATFAAWSAKLFMEKCPVGRRVIVVPESRQSMKEKDKSGGFPETFDSVKSYKWPGGSGFDIKMKWTQPWKKCGRYTLSVALENFKCKVPPQDVGKCAGAMAAAVAKYWWCGMAGWFNYAALSDFHPLKHMAIFKPRQFFALKKRWKEDRCCRKEAKCAKPTKEQLEAEMAAIPEFTASKAAIAAAEAKASSGLNQLNPPNATNATNITASANASNSSSRNTTGLNQLNPPNATNATKATNSTASAATTGGLNASNGSSHNTTASTTDFPFEMLTDSNQNSLT